MFISKSCPTTNKTYYYDNHFVSGFENTAVRVSKTDYCTPESP